MVRGSKCFTGILAVFDMWEPSLQTGMQSLFLGASFGSLLACALERPLEVYLHVHLLNEAYACQQCGA